MSRCCFITDGEQCPNAAEWEIWTEPDPYDTTLSCTPHVGLMLSDGKRHQVYPITTVAPKGPRSEIDDLTAGWT